MSSASRKGPQTAASPNCRDRRYCQSDCEIPKRPQAAATTSGFSQSGNRGSNPRSGTPEVEPNAPPQGRRFLFRVKAWVKVMQVRCRLHTARCRPQDREGDESPKANLGSAP